MFHSYSKIKGNTRFLCTYLCHNRHVKGDDDDDDDEVWGEHNNSFQARKKKNFNENKSSIIVSSKVAQFEKFLNQL